MSNLARSQADWQKLFREFGIFLAPQRELRELAKRFDLGHTRTRVLELCDVNSSTSGWKLSGAKIGVNTDPSGGLFVRIALGTPAAGQAQVSLFTAAGGAAQSLVASGSGVLGALVQLAPQNSSGLSGTVTLGQVTTSEADDKHRLLLFPDWAARMHAAFDGTEPEHGELLEAFMTALAAAETGIQNALTAFTTATDTYLESRWKDFQRSSQTTPVTKTTQDDQGAISIQASGLLEDGSDNMADEQTAGAQTVSRIAVTATPAVFDPTDQGKGVLSSFVLSQWARTGRITAVCTDATLGSEQFTLAQHRTETGDDVLAVNPLQIRRAYSDPNLGIQAAFLDRTVTLDQGSANDFGPVAAFSVQGETPRNTAAGKITLKVVALPAAASGTNFLIQGFTSPSASPETQVFTTAPGAAGASVAITPTNSSGLSGTLVLGAKPTAANTGLLNLNSFALGDKFVVDVTVGVRGAFQDALALLYGYAISSDDPTKATIDDHYVTAGTLLPFEDQS
jgi:hypothetical protein